VKKCTISFWVFENTPGFLENSWREIVKNDNFTILISSCYININKNASSTDVIMQPKALRN